MMKLIDLIKGKISHILSVLLCVVSLIFSHTVYANDPCSSFYELGSKIDTRNEVVNLINVLYKKIQNLMSSEYFNELSEDEHGVYFTRQSGFLFALDCSNPDEKRRIEKIGMFGVGASFKPTKKRIFSDDVYFYGITHSGLMAFIRESDLIKMRKDKAYLFNRTLTKTYFCTNDTYCSGKNKEFSIRHNFAMMDKEQFKRKTSSKTNFDDKGCISLNVEIFNGSKINENKELMPEYKNAKLLYCKRNDNGIFYRNEESVKAYINDLNITGQYNLFSSNLLKELSPLLISDKSCQLEILMERGGSFSLGGSVNSGFDYKFLDASVGIKGSGMYKKITKETFFKDKQYIFQLYTMNQKRPSGHNIENNVLINDIKIVQECGSHTVPVGLNEIKIYFNPRNKEIIYLNSNDLDEDARKSFDEVWVSARDSSKLKGRTWIIASLEQYNNWQDFLYSHIYDDLDSILPDNVDDKVLIDYSNFFLSIFMATSFEYISMRDREKIKIKRRIY